MSFLVRLPEESYRNEAFARFSADAPDFTLENAKAMMWLSQLAYETDDGKKIKRILEQRFGLEVLDFDTNEILDGLFRRKACFIVASGHGATFVAFAGTDPLKPQDIITDLSAIPTSEGLHRGFDKAVQSVRSRVEDAIRKGGVQPLFFTGHSLGGALATIAAMRARDDNFQVTAVYTFGGARAGDQQFFNRYGLDLRNRTFRLVHGKDIVPSVPPSSRGGLLGSLLGDFHHVGRLLHCQQRSTFAGPAPTSSGGNEPDDFVVAGFNALLNIVGHMPSLKLLEQLDPRTLDDPNNDLPEQIRDHVPASYFLALGIRL
jgi:triacylglycerol lipase